MPHAAIAARWSNWKALAVTYGLSASPRRFTTCLSGNIQPSVAIQGGSVPVTMNVSETKAMGITIPLVTAIVACGVGSRRATARPIALNDTDASTRVTRTAGRVLAKTWTP